MSKVSLYKILEKCSEFKKKEERVLALQANDSLAMRSVLQGLFHPDIKFALPEGDPPYRPSEFDEPGRLYQECKKFYLFVEGQAPNLTQVRREKLFIDLLESVPPEDAKLLLAMKDKKSPIKGLTKDVVIAAFPGLFPT
jgi:hypothetical protein